MTQKKQIWKCEICGNIIEVLHEGADSLVCCGEDMKLQEEKTSESEEDEGLKEKHVPVVEKTEEQKGVKVTVGSTEHPMEEGHYIEWITISTEKGFSKKFLKPGDKPEIFFPLNTEEIKPDEITAREYCNVHGLWKKE